MSHCCLYSVGTKRVGVRRLWPPTWCSSCQAHISLWNSAIPCTFLLTGKAFHLQSCEVLLFLGLAALRNRKQFESRAANCRCAHLVVCMGMRFLHSHCRVEGSKVGGSWINMAVLMPPEMSEVLPWPPAATSERHPWPCLICQPHLNALDTPGSCRWHKVSKFRC